MIYLGTDFFEFNPWGFARFLIPGIHVFLPNMWNYLPGTWKPIPTHPWHLSFIDADGAESFFRDADATESFFRDADGAESFSLKCLLSC